MKKYYDWLVGWIMPKNQKPCYRLLETLHSVEFHWSIQMDANRAQDGLDLRYRYSDENGIDDITDELGPCTVLEMMVALAIRCEETIMDDPDIGDRTGFWFWGMIKSMGLSRMTDENFNEALVYSKINKMLDREYQSNGAGGLFTIKYIDHDMRDIEIWYQMLWYLNGKYA